MLSHQSRFNLASGSDDSNRSFSLGFIKGQSQINANSGFSNIELLEANDKNTLYLFGFPYFASNNESLFFVRMVGQRASIQHEREGGRASARRSFGISGGLSKNSSAQFAKPRHSNYGLSIRGDREGKDVDRFIWEGNFLYLLTRQPAQGGDSTEWWPYQIDPAKSKPQGVVRLPTKASHLSIVPGSGLLVSH